MYDIVKVQKFQSIKYAGYKKFSLILLKTSTATHMIPQISTNQQIHD